MPKAKFDENRAMRAIEDAVSRGESGAAVVAALQEEMETPKEARKRIARDLASVVPEVVEVPETTAEVLARIEERLDHIERKIDDN